LSFSVAVQNVLNHVNFGNPIGNLTSPLFGEPNTTAGGFGRGGGKHGCRQPPRRAADEILVLVKLGE